MRHEFVRDEPDLGETEVGERTGRMVAECLDTSKVESRRLDDAEGLETRANRFEEVDPRLGADEKRPEQVELCEMLEL